MGGILTQGTVNLNGILFPWLTRMDTSSPERLIVTDFGEKTEIRRTFRYAKEMKDMEEEVGLILIGTLVQNMEDFG